MQYKALSTVCSCGASHFLQMRLWHHRNSDITCGMEKISLSNYRRQSQGSLTKTSGVEKVLLFKFRLSYSFNLSSSLMCLMF
jgi:hypothetical protein